MTITDLAVPFFGSLLLSAVYFAALWLTIHRAAKLRRPYVWLGLSAMLRIGGLLAGFYVLMNGRWERLVACMVGFVVVRSLCVACVKSAIANTPSDRAC